MDECRDSTTLSPQQPDERLSNTMLILSCLIKELWFPPSPSPLLLLFPSFLPSFATSSLLSQLPSGLSCLSSFFLIYLLIYVLSFLPCLLSTDKGKPFPRGRNQSTEEGHYPTHDPNIVCNKIMMLWRTEVYWRGSSYKLPRWSGEVLQRTQPTQRHQDKRMQEV